MNVGEQSRGEIRKDRKTILREERLKKGKKKEREERETCGCMKDRKRRIIERSHSENKTGED